MKKVLIGIVIAMFVIGYGASHDFVTNSQEVILSGGDGAGSD